MRKAFAELMPQLMRQDPRVVLLLGDIGVHALQPCFEAFPDRCFNMGVLEQGMVSFAAGLARAGFLPVIHTIAPFIVERALEQIKVDFGLNGLPVAIVSVGASYDYAALGATHQCPGDVWALSSIPTLVSWVPGCSSELADIFRGWLGRGHDLFYIRLSEVEHNLPYRGNNLIKINHGLDATVIAVGPTLANVFEAARGLSVTICYVIDVFTWGILPQTIHAPKILLVEPYYRGFLARRVMEESDRPVLLWMLGCLPTHFGYGKREDHERAHGLDVEHIHDKLERLIEA